MPLPILGLVKGAIGIGSAVAKGIKKLKEAKAAKKAGQAPMFEDDSQYYQAPQQKATYQQSMAGKPDGFGVTSDTVDTQPWWKSPVGMGALALGAIVILKKLKIF